MQTIDPNPPRRDRRFRERMHLHLLLITLLGGVLRFWNLGRQSVWMDEAITGYRLAGSYSDLINSLANQAFGPVWFTLLYAFKAVTARIVGDGAVVFSPGLLRMVPAFFGMLVVPASYFLALQFRAFAEHRWALLVALLAAINPYAVYYSRDLKMYGWLLTLFTAQMAFFLCYLRTSRLRNLIIATVMLALLTLTHPTAAWLLLIHLIAMMVTWRGSRWTTIPAAMAMWMFAAIGPAIWYSSGTTVVHRFNTNKNSVGISWIGQTFKLNANLVAETPAVFLTGLGIPKIPPSPAMEEYFQLTGYVGIDHRLARAIQIVLIGFGALLVLGQLPWSRWLGARLPSLNRQGDERFVPHCFLLLWAMLPVGLLVLMSLPPGNDFSIFPRYMIYQPRFLIVCWPAMVLLLATALRNLPGWKSAPLRAIGIALVCCVMLASSLTNLLTYRLPPHRLMCEAAKPFYEANHPNSLLLIESWSDYNDLEPVYACQIALNLRPKFDLWFIQQWYSPIAQMGLRYPRRLHDDPDEWQRLLRRASTRHDIHTIVTFDRLGDTPLLSDEQIKKWLGAHWAKLQQEDSRLRIEWYPYLTYHYRARVWQSTER